MGESMAVSQHLESEEEVIELETLVGVERSKLPRATEQPTEPDEEPTDGGEDDSGGESDGDEPDTIYHG
ncbi:MAG TPA: hypothetical protein VGH27_34585 [Streptosporangiaceae bacterium]|jgi:hypothetical protein